MAEITLEALQHFMLENGCKVKSSDAIEFFRQNFAGKPGDQGKFLSKTVIVVYQRTHCHS